MKNKMILLVMMLSMIFSYSIPVLAEETEENNVSAQSEINPKLVTLVALGIVDEDDNYSENLTRAEFSALLCKLLNGMVLSYNEVYTDVKKDNIYCNDIMTMYTLGVVCKDTYFNPDRAITYDEAIAMIVRLLGYEKQAELNGGYPSGYRKIALDNDLPIFSYEYVTWDMAIDLIYEVMQAPCVTIKDVRGNVIRYEISDNVTLLSYYFDIRRHRGIISANSLTSLYSDKGVGSDCVQINGEEYHVGNTDAHKYLGYKVDYWYKDVDSEYELMCIDTEKYTDVTTIIADSDTVYKNGVLSWYEHERQKNVTIPVDAMIIYNGVAAGTHINENNFVPENGKITLIDNNADSVCNVVYIDEYENIAVKASNKELEIITGQYNEILNLKNKQKGVDYLIHDEYKNEIDFEFLREWDILNIRRAKNDKFIDILVTEESITGKAESKNNESINVAGINYKYSPCFAKKNVNISLGTNVTLYFNCLGLVAEIKKGAAENNVAYLTNAYIDEDLETAYLSLLLIDGNTQKVECNNKVTINSRRYEGGDIIKALKDINKVDYGSDGTNILRQLIMYNLNEDGKVTKMVLPDIDEVDDFYCSFREAGRDTKTKTRGYEKSVANRKIVLDDNAKIFIVPQDPNSDNKDKIYSVKNTEYMLSRLGSDDIVETYHSTNKKLGAEYLVLYVDDGDESYIPNDTAVHIVDEWITALNDDDDEIIQRMYLYGKNGAVTKDVSVDYVLEDVKTNDGEANLGKGDIIRFAENGMGEITYIEICYSYELDRGYKIGEFVTQSKYAYRTDNDANALMAADFDKELSEPALDEAEAMSLERFTLYYFDNTLRSDKIRKGTVSDIMPFDVYSNHCSRVIISRQAGDPRSIVIYNDGT